MFLRPSPVPFLPDLARAGRSPYRWRTAYVTCSTVFACIHSAVIWAGTFLLAAGSSNHFAVALVTASAAGAFVLNATFPSPLSLNFLPIDCVLSTEITLFSTVMTLGSASWFGKLLLFVASKHCFKLLATQHISSVLRGGLLSRHSGSLRTGLRRHFSSWHFF